MQVAKQNGYHSCATYITSLMTPNQLNLLDKEVMELVDTTAASTHSHDCSSSSMRNLLVDLGKSVDKISLKPTIPVEKHIFSLGKTRNIPTNEVEAITDLSITSEVAACNAPRAALSKLVEFPGDVDSVRQMLEQQIPVAVDPAGKDMFGVAAIHKFSAWNKVDLLQLLIPYLTLTELNSRGLLKLFV